MSSSDEDDDGHESVSSGGDVEAEEEEYDIEEIAYDIAAGVVSCFDNNSMIESWVPKSAVKNEKVKSAVVVKLKEISKQLKESRGALFKVDEIVSMLGDVIKEKLKRELESGSSRKRMRVKTHNSPNGRDNEDSR